MRWLAVIVLLGGLSTGCAAKATPAARPVVVAHDVGIANGTTMFLSLVVNGKPLGIFAPHSTSAVEVRSEFPWVVEAHASSGRLLVSTTVLAGDIKPPAHPGGDEQSNAFKRVDLSCGQIAIFGGDVPPAASQPGPGTAGDCTP